MFLTLADNHGMKGECLVDFEDLVLSGAGFDHFAGAFSKKGSAGSAWKESDWPVEVYLASCGLGNCSASPPECSATRAVSS